MSDKKDKYINKHLEKTEKGIVDIMIDTVLEYAGKDIQAVLDLLPDDPESEGDT